jgi:acyl-CoA thioesterase-1
MIKGTLYIISMLLIFVMAYFNMQDHKSFVFVPLGDSYTIGTGVKEQESWPNQLIVELHQHGLNYTLPVNPARNGFTTEDLIREELPLLSKFKPQLVTVLIGVNDWIQGISEGTFRRNLGIILDEVQKQLPPDGRVIVITIPDFGVTPSGKKYTYGRDSAKGISEFNDIIRFEAQKRRISVSDIFPVSQKMAYDRSLISEDGLHPSGKEYGLWTKIIAGGVIDGK